MMMRMAKMFCMGVVFTGLLSSCSTTQKITNSARTATEQLLISEAVTRSLPKQSDSPLPIPQGNNVLLDITGISADKVIVQDAVVRWLGQHGYTVQDASENTTYRINIVVSSVGTELADTFVGIPPVHGSLVPISLPELAFYKADYQTGYVNFHLDIFEFPSGRYIGSSLPFVANTFYNVYTVLFLFTFKRTDLISPPRIGSFH
jgi:hypothetical protein